ncbi:MAG: hypothetical protein IE916_08000 [Epsilonproteobacteria bacterium]|nr:hypothetical protein [Campylobacterota bacterium]
MEFYLKHQKSIIRGTGIVLLVIGFVVQFWMTPKEGLSKEEIAAANVARMEASIRGAGSSQGAKSEQKPIFMEEFRNKQEKHFRYMTIIAMIAGVIFIGYTFIKKEG